MGTVMKWIIGLYFVGTLPFPGSAGTQLKGVATIPDLGAIVRAVGGAGCASKPSPGAPGFSSSTAWSWRWVGCPG